MIEKNLDSVYIKYCSPTSTILLSIKGITKMFEVINNRENTMFQTYNPEG